MITGVKDTVFAVAVVIVTKRLKLMGCCVNLARKVWGEKKIKTKLEIIIYQIH